MAARKSKSKGGKIVLIVAVIAVIFSFITTFYPEFGLPSWKDIYKGSGLTYSAEAEKQPFSIHFIDTWQGDSILIKNGDAFALVDAGTREAETNVISYLDYRNVKTISYFVITHPHTDHIGNAVEVLKRFKVENIIMTRYTEENVPTTDSYQKLLAAIRDSGAKVHAARVGDAYTFADTTLTILGPTTDYKDLNNSSVVCKVQYGENKFLLQGDAEKKAEKDILKTNSDLHADVIKLGHHGSRSSSSEAYLLAVQPRLAIISCGKDNVYKHPHDETLETLNKLHIKYERTDFKGTIVIGSDGKNLITELEHDNK